MPLFSSRPSHCSFPSPLASPLLPPPPPPPSPLPPSRQTKRDNEALELLAIKDEEAPLLTEGEEGEAAAPTEGQSDAAGGDGAAGSKPRDGPKDVKAGDVAVDAPLRVFLESSNALSSPPPVRGAAAASPSRPTESDVATLA